MFYSYKYLCYCIIIVSISCNGINGQESYSPPVATYDTYSCEDEDLYIRCPQSTYIDVKSAQYGRTKHSSIICPFKHLPQYQNTNILTEDLNCISPNSMNVVELTCQERRVCRIKASTRNFYPDPCPKTGKYLTITYQCIPYLRETKTACEGRSLDLSCDRGRRLYISDAQFGWDVMIPQACVIPRRNKLPTPTPGCLSSIAEKKMGTLCHNKRTCTVTADTATFGRFCADADKYLKVSYVCVPKRMLQQGDEAAILEELQRGELSARRRKPSSVVVADPFSSSSVSKPTRTLNLSQGEGVNSPDADPTCTNCTPGVIPDHPHSESDANLVFGWVHSINYLRENQEKVILYGMLCGCLAFIMALVVFIIRMLYIRRLKRRQQRHQKLHVQDTNTTNIQDTSNEENTYVAAGDPSDMAILQYNLPLATPREPTNRLNSGPGSYRGSHTTGSHHRFHIDAEPNRFNTNSLTVSNPIHVEHRRNLNTSPHTTASTGLNNSPNTAQSDQRNTFYENSGDDEHTNDDNDGPVVSSTSKLWNRPGSADVRPKNNALFDRHS